MFQAKLEAIWEGNTKSTKKGWKDQMVQRKRDDWERKRLINGLIKKPCRFRKRLRYSKQIWKVSK